MNDKLNQVHALIDGELNVDEREETLRSIDRDPSLAREYAWAHTLKDLVHSKCQAEAPEGGWEAAKKRIAEIERVKTTNHVVAKYGWALCGVLFVGVATAGYMNQVRRSSTLSSSAVAGIFDFAPGKAKPIAESAKPFRVFDDLQLNAKDGAKFDYAVSDANGPDSKVKVWMEDAKGPFLVAVFPGLKSVPGIDQAVGYSDYKVGIVNSHPCVSWISGKYLLVLTSDRNWDQLEEAANRVR